ncbi:hypothetical protein AX774_g908 [Zancudomyces culisetae]|uniref:Uncharacterized protein n=1 Tax=Zancudomyces culisetae TaxID=1213189 RepID=A0A1R1PX45_ZANCU|nr:hypothetical protein AX774_g908 [Zancudomyces culisetae]|eukprot:OMH85519.1 hypothetical protein AX774_g908 [Zancudomyces culisetae]
MIKDRKLQLKQEKTVSKTNTLVVDEAENTENVENAETEFKENVDSSSNVLSEAQYGWDQTDSEKKTGKSELRHSGTSEITIEAEPFISIDISGDTTNNVQRSKSTNDYKRKSQLVKADGHSRAN